MNADFSRVVAIVPVRSLAGSKSRLGEPLDSEERADLILGFLRRTVTAALAANSLTAVVVVSQDAALLRLVGEMAAGTLLQQTDGLNEALSEARLASCVDATALLVLPADLPDVAAWAIDRLVGIAAYLADGNPEQAVVGLVPDRHGTGTNALIVSPPWAIDFEFGEASRAAHSAAAARAGAAYFELDGPLSFDVDTAEDLLQADMAGLGHEAGR
jgi:2-phospho-L-lactate/phosphoenolpyruvate guanylyltransferase